jgi:hypothetical protein
MAAAHQVIPPTTSASTATPLVSRSTVNKPKEFSGDDPIQNERVERWVAAMNRYLHLSKVPSHLHLDTARSYFSSAGGAEEWIASREEEVAYSGKQMTWDWLQLQLIEHYAQPSGPAAMEAEWEALRMGIKSTDGQDTGKSTRSVKSYTNRFLHYMRLLTEHTAQTSDILVINRYVSGIRMGYEALFTVMLGVQHVLRFTSLQGAINAAEEAEAEMAIAKMAPRPPSTSSWNATGRFRGNGRAATESLNNLQGEPSDEGEDQGTTPNVRVFGFRYSPGPDDGRYKLSEKEAKMLYDERRCYRCYGEHPVGPRHSVCKKPVMKTAPKSLK